MKKKAAQRALLDGQADHEIDSNGGVKTNGVGNTPLTGMKKWLAEYRAKRPGLSVLQAEIDAFMADYDAREEKSSDELMVAAEADKSGSPQIERSPVTDILFAVRSFSARRDKIAAAEEDGWTVVVGSKGRKKTTDMQSGITVGAVSTAAVTEKATNRSKKEAVVDFYRFQKRETRRNELLDLQQKFVENKKRTAKLREARKFRPY